MSDVITALKRLERAGAEEGRTVEKLKAASRTLGDALVAILPESNYLEPGGLLLPRCYAIDGKYLCWGNGDPGYTVNDDETTRETALRFARDIATGWLDELADWLDKRDGESESSAETLCRAMAALGASAEHQQEMKS